MTTQADPNAMSRAPLSRERVLGAAVALADRGGIGALSMRKLAQELGVEAMSLYHHVANKDDILDGIVDVVFSEIELPSGDADWKAAMRQRAISAREALLRHPWATGLMESRSTPGPATLRHHDAVLGILRTAGFSVERHIHVAINRRGNILRGDRPLLDVAAVRVHGMKRAAAVNAGRKDDPAFARPINSVPTVNSVD